jgi:hypothetical protein
MRSLRVLPVVLVAVLAAALSAWWQGAPVEPTGGLTEMPVPVVRGTDDPSATWYCAAGKSAAPSAPDHSLVLANPTDARVPVRLSAYGVDGQEGSQEVSLEPSSTIRYPVEENFGSAELSVMVESPSAEIAVEHRLVAEGAGDQVPCATSASDRWFFLAQTTTLGTSGRLVLFNPFSADAGVDISASVEDGVRIPAAWAGIVVPAGTTRVIELGDEVQRRELFSLSLELRTGRVIAETVQSFDDDDTATGIRMQLGVPAPRSRWGFADGFTDPGVDELLVVHNPGEQQAAVVVQVTPADAAASPPEPFELIVPGRRYGVIDLSGEARVPGVGHHSIQVETSAETPVVVARLIGITDELADTAEDGDVVEEGEEDTGESAAEDDVIPRPDVGGGVSIGTGSALVSDRWIVPQVSLGGGQDPALVVLNPTRSPLRVTAESFGATAETVLDEVEVPAGGMVIRPLRDLEAGSGEIGIRIRADGPILVERIVTMVRVNDLSVGLAVPVQPGGGGRFTFLGEL